MGTKLSINGITFGDATVQNTAATTGVTSLTAGSGISVSGATGAVTVSATGGGTVTSVGTGNGLSGGTITSSGTLVLAAPSFNSVGSYATVVVLVNQGSTVSSGGSYSAGTGNLQFRAGFTSSVSGTSNSLSGTWQWMSVTFSQPGGACDPTNIPGLAVRVS